MGARVLAVCAVRCMRRLAGGRTMMVVMSVDSRVSLSDGGRVVEGA